MTEAEEKQFQLIQELADIVAELGWMIAIPENDEGLAAGLVLGNQDFLVEVLGDNMDNYDILEMDTDLKPKEGLH